jgi:hypothetical protein
VLGALRARSGATLTALTCEKEYVRFKAAEGAGDHCEAGARTLYHARSFGWLDAIPQPQRTDERD